MKDESSQDLASSSLKQTVLHEVSAGQLLPCNMLAYGFTVRNTFIDLIDEEESVVSVRKAASEPPRSKEMTPRSDSDQEIFVLEIDTTKRCRKMEIEYLQKAMVENHLIKVVISLEWWRGKQSSHGFQRLRQRLKLPKNVFHFETDDDLLSLKGLAFILQPHTSKFPRGMLFLTNSMKGVFYINANSKLMQISWAKCFDLHFGERPPCFFLELRCGFPSGSLRFLMECELESPSADFSGYPQMVMLERKSPTTHRRLSRIVWSLNRAPKEKSATSFCIQWPSRHKVDGSG